MEAEFQKRAFAEAVIPGGITPSAKNARPFIRILRPGPCSPYRRTVRLASFDDFAGSRGHNHRVSPERSAGASTLRKIGDLWDPIGID